MVNQAPAATPHNAKAGQRVPASNCSDSAERPLQARNFAFVPYIGPVWPCWPTHVRVTIGTREEMGKFQAVLLKVMA